MPRVDSLFNEEKGNNGMYYQVGEMKSVVFKNTNPYLIDIRFEIWFKIWFIIEKEFDCIQLTFLNMGV